MKLSIHTRDHSTLQNSNRQISLIRTISILQLVWVVIKLWKRNKNECKESKDKTWEISPKWCIFFHIYVNGQKQKKLKKWTIFAQSCQWCRQNQLNLLNYSLFIFSLKFLIGLTTSVEIKLDTGLTISQHWSCKFGWQVQLIFCLNNFFLFKIKKII